MRLPPIVWVLGGWMVGILLGDAMPVNAIVVYGGALASALAAAFFHRYYFQKKLSQIGFLAGLIVCTVCMGMAGVRLQRARQQIKAYQPLESSVPVQGIIVKSLKNSEKYYKYFAEIRSIDGQPNKAGLLIYLPKGQFKIPPETDDVFIGLLRLSEVPKPLNPHEFDYRRYLADRGVFLQAYVNENTPIILKKGERHSLVGISEGIINRIEKELSASGLSPENMGMFKALFFGDKSDLSDEVYEQFKDAGVLHLLAVSGSNILILFSFFGLLLIPLNRMSQSKLIKWLQLLLILAGLWFYAFLVGFSPSVLRAVAMFTFYLIGIRLQRVQNPYNTLSATAFLILLFDPLSLYDVGFQLSYLAVVSIFLLAPLSTAFRSPKTRLARVIWQAIWTCVSVQLFLLPLSLFYFHQFAGLFLVANLGILLVLEVFMGLCVVVSVLTFFGFLPVFAAKAVDFLITTLKAFCEYIAGFDVFVFKNVYFNVLYLFLGYLVIGALYRLVSKFNFSRAASFLVSVALLQLGFIYDRNNTQKVEKVTIFNAYNGSLISLQTGESLKVYGAAEMPQIQRIINNYRSNEGVKNIEYAGLKNSLRYKDFYLVCVDSFGIYLPQPEVSMNKIVLLRESPKINLERMIETTKPKAIIADGSNNKYLSRMWRQTCEEKGIPFHDTSREGAYRLDVFSRVGLATESR